LFTFLNGRRILFAAALAPLLLAVPAAAVTIKSIPMVSVGGQLQDVIRPGYSAAGVSPFLPGFTRTGSGNNAVYGPGTFTGNAIVKSSPTIDGFSGNYLELKSGSWTYSFGSNVVRSFSFAFNGIGAGNDNNSSTITVNFIDTRVNPLGVAGNVVFGSTIDASPLGLLPLLGAPTGRAYIDSQSAGVRFTSIRFLAPDNPSQINIDSIAAAAPEPATWGMLILGFGMAGLGLRRGAKAHVLA
jgi:hypothetical protein